MNQCQGLACSSNNCLGLTVVAVAILQLLNCLSGWIDRAVCFVQNVFAALTETCMTADDISLHKEADTTKFCNTHRHAFGYD